MNIQALSSQVIYHVTENIRYSLDMLDKRILVVASVVFACIAAIYAYKYSQAQQALQAALFTGHANFTSPVGDIIDGEFVDGMLQGQGKVIRKNGEIWEGEFKQNQLEGAGKKTYSDGTEEEGLFKAGKFIEVGI
jgi:hypothetical protein